MKLIHRILCPLDFSPASDLAFRYAEQLAESVGASLVLVHAFDVPATLDLVGQWKPADPHLQQQLDQVQTSLPAERMRREMHAGSPGEVICWLAQQRECDLIVMGTHGRTGLKHLLFGSTAEHVLRHARCPVLTIRYRAADEPPLPEPVVLPQPPPRFM